MTKRSARTIRTTISEAHGYTWEPKREHWPVPPWLLVAVSLLIVVALLLPGLIFLLRHG